MRHEQKVAVLGGDFQKMCLPAAQYKQIFLNNENTATPFSLRNCHPRTSSDALIYALGESAQRIREHVSPG